MATSELSVFKFTLLFIRYAIWPNKEQKEYHSFMVQEAIQYILRDSIIHAIFHTLCWYLLSNYLVLNIIANTILTVYDIIEILIGHGSYLRECILVDLYEYMTYQLPRNARPSYRSVKFSLNEWVSYFRYYVLDKPEICPICLEEFANTPDQPELLIKCGHKFHKECLNGYEESILRSNIKPKHKCPSCRFSYIPIAATNIFNENYYKETWIWYKPMPKYIEIIYVKLFNKRRDITNLCISWIWPSGH